ncbi:MAG: MFS transporter, partial [Saccharolobus sp.]
MKGKESLVYIIIIIIISTLSARAVNIMIMTTVPSFAKYELSMNDLYVGLLASSLSMTTLISTVFINPFLSSPKRRMAFILSTISIIFLLIFYYFSSKVTIWIITIITGLVYGFIMPNLITFASIARDKKNAERLLNIYSMSLSLSLVIGPLLETFLLERYSYRDIFILFLPLAIPLAFLSKNVKFPETTKEVRSFSVLKNHGL